MAQRILEVFVVGAVEAVAGAVEFEVVFDVL